MIYETDQGTLQLIDQMKPPARERLRQYLNRGYLSEITFYRHEFHDRDDIQSLKLEPHAKKDGIVVATAEMADGVLWRRGSLRVPGIVLPETLRIGAKGRLLEEVVDGAPFKGFVVTSLVQDGSGATGKLRICCTASKTGPILV